MRRSATLNFEVYGTTPPNAGTVVASSTRDNATFRMPYEFVQIGAGTYDLKILHTAGPEAVRLKITAFSSSVTFNEYPADSSKSTITGHAAAARAAAVAAAPYSGYTSGAIESFSSRGQPNVYLDGQYRRLETPQTRQKPNFAAPDGGNTTFFYSDDSDPDGYPNFYGTSAAAPHAAAVAALLLQQRPSLSPQQVYDVLADTATDWGTAGWDKVYGAGSIDAYNAYTALTNPASYTDTTGPVATEYSVQPFGTYPVDNFTVWFSEELNAVAAGERLELRTAARPARTASSARATTRSTRSRRPTPTPRGASRSIRPAAWARGSIGSRCTAARLRSWTRAATSSMAARTRPTISRSEMPTANAILAQQIQRMSWADVAINSANRSVVVWADSTVNVSFTSVYVQRYDETGEALWKCAAGARSRRINSSGETNRSTGPALGGDGGRRTVCRGLRGLRRINGVCDLSRHIRPAIQRRRLAAWRPDPRRHGLGRRARTDQASPDVAHHARRFEIRGRLGGWRTLDNDAAD